MHLMMMITLVEYSYINAVASCNSAYIRFVNSLCKAKRGPIQLTTNVPPSQIKTKALLTRHQTVVQRIERYRFRKCQPILSRLDHGTVHRSVTKLLPHRR